MAENHMDLDIESGYDMDEKLLVDFHLGNALNLDIIDKVVTNNDPGYNLLIPEYYMTDYRRALSFSRNHASRKVGFLEPTSDMLSLPSAAAQFHPWVYKRIVDILNRGLRKKDIKIPLTEYAEKIQSNQILVREMYEKVFRKILRGISMLSELLRGGENSVYTDVIMLQTHTKITLLEQPCLLELIIGRNVSTLYSQIDDTLYVGNYDSVLLLMDTLGQRICLDIGCQITRLTKTPGYIPKDILESIILLGDQILRAAGNDGYEIIAMFEASVVSSILKSHPDQISDSEMFYRNCMGELYELCENQPWGEEVYASWTEMIDLLCHCPPSILSNIFCIYRIWGHPRVNILAGMDKVYNKGMIEKHTTKASAKLVICQFRRMFLGSYLSRNKRYPPVDIPDGDTYVYNRLRKGLPIDRNTPGFNIWDYNEIQIGQIWSLPETYDVCHILNDKAVSPNRSEVYHSIKNGQGTMSGSLRRGIIRWMEGESIRCKEFLDKVDKQGLDLDSLIIGMYEKEREIKVKARMFSLMSEEMRMYFVLTEELIANHIIPYFPEITMKDPLHIQLRKIWAVGGKGQNPLNPNINIDFEKWNLNMRDEFTDELFKQIDQMFGYKSMISRTHEIFKESYIYSSSGKYLPSIKDGGLLTDPPMAYIGHLGGFEGLRQKGWTVATVCLLAYIAEELGLEMCLLGQGDNQVLKLYMPIPKWSNLCYTEQAMIASAKDLTGQFTESMQIYFSDAGLPIKIRETWISSRLFMYGKAMYLDGVNLPQWSKKLLRSYAMSNEGSITMSGVIGTIATNMSAAAGASEQPDIMYILYLIMAEWSADYLLGYHPFTRETISTGQKIPFKIPGHDGGKMMKSPRMIYLRLMATLLTVPTSVGGSVTIPLTSFIVRGFPDHASEGYAWLKLLASVESSLQILYINWYSFLQNSTIQPDMLLQSPWSINHLKPPTPGLQSRELVREWLLSGRFGNNKFLRNMSKLGVFFDRKRVCQELLSDPMNPLISYEIYQGFPQSYYDSILRRFEGTRSVKKMAMKEVESRPIVKKLMAVEHQYIGYLIWRAEQTGRIFSDCATQHTREARDGGWGRHIIGLTTPHPLEFLFDRICEGFSPQCEGDDHIYLRSDIEGKAPPYLGSKVKTKVVSQQDEGARSEPLICTNARIARYINWLGVGPNLKNVVEISTRAVCDFDIYDNFFEEDPYGEMYSGSIEHRFNPAAASEGCFINYAPQIGSRVMMSSDHMPKFGRGKANYTLHFQAMYCFLQYIGAKLEQNVSKHYHLCCESCIVPVEEEIGDIEAEHPGIDLAFDENILPTLRETIGEIREKPITHFDLERKSLPGDYVRISDDVQFRSRAYYGVVLLLSVKCAMSIFIRGHKQSEGLGSDDLQSFPRVYSYKLYADHIIWTTVRVLAYIQAIHSDEVLNMDTMPRIKKRLNKVVMNSPLSKFKEISSLCLGRTLSRNSWINLANMSHGGFPETTTTFMRMIKHIIIEEIGKMGSNNREYPKKINIPSLSCSVKEHQFIIGYLSSIYGCGECMTLPKNNDEDAYRDCRDGHVRKMLNTVGLVNTPLDRIMKVISIKSVERDPTQIIIPTAVSEIKVWTVRHPVDVQAISFEIMNRELREVRMINLPTSSIYKWASIMSSVKVVPKVVIVLGDGTGGTSYIAARVFPEATVFPCAFIEGKHGIPQDLESIRPGLSRQYKNVSSSLQEAIPDDIFSTEWNKSFYESLELMETPILIISDIETAGGSWKAVERLFESVPDSIYILAKMYGTEIHLYHNYMFPSDHASILCNMDCNAQYGEFMISIHTGNGKHCLELEHGINSAYDKLKRIDIKSLHHIQSEIERQAHEASELSVRLSLDRINTYGISITRTLVREGGIILFGAAMSFISSRYRFPQDKIRSRDVRNLTDGTLDRIVRGLKIIILASHTEEIVSQEWYNGFYLARCTHENRFASLRGLKIVPVYNRPGRVVMDTKDIGAARTIRKIMGIKSTLLSLEDFHENYVLPALNRTTSRQIDMLGMINDTIETLSDLSHTTTEM